MFESHFEKNSENPNYCDKIGFILFSKKQNLFKSQNHRKN